MILKIKRLETKDIVEILKLAFLLIISLKFFQSTLLQEIFFQLHGFYLTILLFFLIIYLIHVSIRKRYSKVIVYYLVLMSIIPFVSTINAKINFGQPLIFGILAQRGWIIIGTSIYFYYYLITKDNSLERIKYTIIFLAWLSLIFFALYKITIDTGNLGDTFIYAKETYGRGIRFKFQNYFISFGFIYYFIKYITDKKYSSLMGLLLFLLFILFIISGRTYTIAMLLTIVVYYYRNNSFSQFIKKIIILLIIILLIVLGLYIFANEFIVNFINLYIQAFKVVLGNLSLDPSANSRLLQSAKVINYFANNIDAIYFGFGDLSQQWNDGFKKYLGYFYPSDIGVLGGVFLYGIFGLFIIYIFPFIISIKCLFINSAKENIFIESMKYLLVFFMVLSLRGSYYFAIVQYTLPLFVLLGYNKIKKLSNDK